MVVVYAKHSWNGDISVEKGEHVDVVGNGHFRWYTIKKKGTEKKGMISNAILRNCPDNIKRTMRFTRMLGRGLQKH